MKNRSQETRKMCQQYFFQEGLCLCSNVSVYWLVVSLMLQERTTWRPTQTPTFGIDMLVWYWY